MSERNTRYLVAMLLVVTFVATFAGLALLTGVAHAERPASGRSTNPQTPSSPEDALVVPGLSAAIAVQDVQDTAAYLIALDRQQVADLIVATQQAEAQAAIARQPASASYTPNATVGATVGDCTGFAIPAYIIQRESGGNPSAYNPSGAYGCAQTMLGHYATGGSCAGLNPYDIQGQRDCVNILSSGGTNLAPWAETA